MNPAAPRVAAFTVKADARQSARWKRTAEPEGFPSVGSWAALALDAYVELRVKGDLPVPLVWDSATLPGQTGGQNLPGEGEHLATIRELQGDG